MRALIVAMLTLWTATCGQKGPLELPEPRTVQMKLVTERVDVDTERVDVDTERVDVGTERFDVG